MVPVIAGLAWIGSAAAIGYLALLQVQYTNLGLPGSDDLAGLALRNGASAVITLYFGTKLIVDPTRRLLTNSTVWAALTVGWGIYQVSQGVTAEVYLLALVLAGVAGILSFVAQGSMPVMPVEKPASKSSRRAEAVLIVLILIAVAIGIAVVMSR